LLARVESLLRRKNWLRNSGAAKPERVATEGDSSDVFQFDDRTVDFANLQLRGGGQVFQLTLMEAELLRYLIRNSDRPVSRKAILQNVWNLHEDTDTRAIDNFIVRLRRYLEDSPANPKYLITVRGIGYRFLPESGNADE
jgi:two-component system, OmpR family, alkaline phosphatase synthesis response regulator PhoP